MFLHRALMVVTLSIIAVALAIMANCNTSLREAVLDDSVVVSEGSMVIAHLVS